MTILWGWIFQKDFGIINYILSLVGIKGPNWLGDKNVAMISIVILSLWTIGNNIIIMLAGIPVSYTHLDIDADLIEVKEKRNRSTFNAYVCGSLAARRQKKTEIKEVTFDLSEYAKVIVAVPIWAGFPSTPFNNILELLPAGKEIELILSLIHILGGSHPAVKNYKIFKSGAQETMQSILAILYARLQCFRLEKVQWLTAYDECDLYSIGLGVHGNPDKTVAFFILIPDETVLYSPIVGMLYTQLFQILFAQARKCGGALPFDVGFYLDEYPNIKMPGDFIR